MSFMSYDRCNFSVAIYIIAGAYFDHYANMSVQYTAIFHGCKKGNFQMKIVNFFFLFYLKT